MSITGSEAEKRRLLALRFTLDDPGPKEDDLEAAAEEHMELLKTEYEEVEAFGLLQHARGQGAYELALIAEEGSTADDRRTLQELLGQHDRIVVVAPRGAGKSTLVALAAAQAARKPMFVPFVVPVEMLAHVPRLDEPTIARFSPAAGLRVVRRALAAGRALVLVDGLEAAGEGTAALAESIVAFASARPGNRFVVTTCPRRTGLPGFQRVGLPGFMTAALLPARSSSVYPAHRFLGRRAPRRKADLYRERIDTLLAAWDRTALPAGSVLGRLDRGDQRTLFQELAWYMHSRLQFEVDHAELAKTLHLTLTVSSEGDLRIASNCEPLAETNDISPLIFAIVHEIQAYPGLLRERRPGVFAFVDFAFQEFLTAAAICRSGGIPELIEHRKQRWWHEVVVLSASQSDEHAMAVVTNLMNAERIEFPDTTILLARCVEAVPDLPERTRRTIARRLAELVPPRDLLGIERLVELGDSATPVVLAALPGASPEEHALSALVLGRLHAQAACGALIHMASDTTRVNSVVGVPIGNRELYMSNQPVGGYALVALFLLARVSNAGRKAFYRALPRVPPKALEFVACWTDRYLCDPEIDGEEPVRDLERVRSLVGEMFSVLAKRAH